MSDSRISQSRGRPEPTGSAAGSTQRLTVLYIASSSAIAGLAIIGQVWIQQALNRQSLDIQVISAAQQQQRSSQRLVKSILALKLPAMAEEQRERAQELEAAIQAAEASLQTLADIQNSTALPTRRRQQVQQ
ncbi:MAG: hypothetical protein AAFX01_09285 [Cyanobacteria bacterium J06638_28]